MSSYPPPPADATDVLPGEDGGDYASRKAEAAAIADAARLPEWVLLAEVARRCSEPAPNEAHVERMRKAYAPGEHPWDAFLAARFRVMAWLRSDGVDNEGITNTCNLDGAAHVERILRGRTPIIGLGVCVGTSDTQSSPCLDRIDLTVKPVKVPR